jgi:hypothetical protein
MFLKLTWSSVILICAVSTQAADRVAEIPDDDFQRLSGIIKPQKGESPWREIAWLTNVTAARKKAAAEGKPIVIFTAADGSPLGRT